MGGLEHKVARDSFLRRSEHLNMKLNWGEATAEEIPIHRDYRRHKAVL